LACELPESLLTCLVLIMRQYAVQWQDAFQQFSERPLEAIALARDAVQLGRMGLDEVGKIAAGSATNFQVASSAEPPAYVSALSYISDHDSIPSEPSLNESLSSSSSESLLFSGIMGPNVRHACAPCCQSLPWPASTPRVDNAMLDATPRETSSGESAVSHDSDKQDIRCLSSSFLSATRSPRNPSKASSPEDDDDHSGSRSELRCSSSTSSPSCSEDEPLRGDIASAPCHRPKPQFMYSKDVWPPRRACKLWESSGACAYGDGCRFLHDDSGGLSTKSNVASN
jgi:hypothetical protein